MSKFLSYIKNKRSIVVIILVSLTITQINLNLSKFKKQDVIKWDVVGYYSYLPAIFIENDLRLNFITPENEQTLSWNHYGYIYDKEGHRIIKYSMGTAVLYAPFFILAHVLAEPLGFAPDGFSSIYHFFIQFSSLFYLIIGLLFLRKLLLKHYTESLVALTIGIVFFGTNLLYYSSVESAMSHSYTFSLTCVLLFLIDKYYARPSVKTILFLGVVAGLIILIRPLNGILCMSILLYNTTNNPIKNRLDFIKQHLKHVLLFFVTTLLVILPQLIYYKYVTGDFLAFSYGEKEKFYFSNPHLIDVLFSFRKGWFIYTPIMLITIIGWFIIRKHNLQGFKTSLSIIFPLYLFLVSSWWCWWYGGSFSQRTLIDIYPFLALVLIAVLDYVNKQNLILKRCFYGLISVLIALNLLQTVQYKYNIIDYDGMTFEAYKHVFGSIDSNIKDSTLLHKPNYENAILGKPE